MGCGVGRWEFGWHGQVLLPVCMKMEPAVGKSTRPGRAAELVFEELEGGTNVNILNLSLEKIVGLLLAGGLGGSLPGCLPEVGDLFSGLL